MLLVCPGHLFSTVQYSTGKFASRWKISKTIPLLKDKELSKLDPTSYRPIAVLLTLSKIIDKVAQVQLCNYLEETKQLNANCHSYRTGLSTTTTLFQLVDSLYEGAENRDISSIMTIDQSSAFDCVEHSVLLNKLKLYCTI